MTFVVIEGINGAGKSLLRAGLEDCYGDNAIYCSEPSDMPLGYAIRAELKMAGNPVRPPNSLQPAFLADRMVQLEKVIAPALAENKLVICERWVQSSYIYPFAQHEQSPGRLWITERAWIELVVRSKLNMDPDLLIWLDCTAAVALERKGGGDEELHEYQALERQYWHMFSDMANVRSMNARRAAADILEATTKLIDRTHIKRTLNLSDAEADAL